MHRRGQGVGDALLRALLAAVPRMSLSVDARNPARHLYERHGFVVKDTVKVSDKGPTIWFMWREPQQ